MVTTRKCGFSRVELRRAIRDPSQLPDGALLTAAEFGDGSDEEFLRRLWGDLHGGRDV